MEMSMFDAFLGRSSELRSTPSGTLQADLTDSDGDEFSVEFFGSEAIEVVSHCGHGCIVLDREKALAFAKLIINQLEQGE